MTPMRPYLLRAQYDWIVDNELTPLLVVDTTVPGVVVPTDFVEHGQIVLNIAPMAVRGLMLGKEAVVFSGRFAGVAWDISIPLAAVKALYARENGQGMLFEDDGYPSPPEPSPEPTEGPASSSQDAAALRRGRASLKVVK